MRLLDRHVIRLFVVNHLILTVVLLGLFFLVDLIVDLDEFLQAGNRLKDNFGGGFFGSVAATFATVVDYYAPLLLMIYVFFSGLIAVGAMGFTLNGLQRTRELTAMLAGGISLYRVALPIVAVGALLSVATLPLQEFVLPNFATKLTRSKSDLKDGVTKQDALLYIPDGAGRLWSAAGYDVASGELTDVRVLERDERGLQSRVVTADQAVWREPASDGVAGADASGRWELIQGFAVRPLSGLGEAEPVDAIPSRLSPKVLLARRGALFPAVLSVRDLQRLRGNPAVVPAQRAVLKRTLWGRFSLVALNVLLLLMTLPYFLRPLPAGGIRPALQAVAVALGAWGGGMLTLQASPAALPPAVSAWLPVAVALPLAAWGLTRVRT